MTHEERMLRTRVADLEMSLIVLRIERQLIEKMNHERNAQGVK